VWLSLPHLFEKHVTRERGGYCYELNGLFGWLLAALGYDVDRVAARVTSDTGIYTPANHHPLVVHLDQSFVVDVGMGTPMMRQPTPLVGSPRTDDVGVSWRVTASDRPDEMFQTEYRGPGDDEWIRRYVFSTTPRELSYFEATCDYLQTAPESTFTDDPIVAIATAEGHRKLSGETLTETVGREQQERTVPTEAFHATLRREFGLQYDETDSRSDESG
jgi:N-hydroxyarylamine O-acetyltransferase